MNQTVALLERAVEQLGREDLAAFREWFSSFEAAEWDAQIERDIAAGKLDKLSFHFLFNRSRRSPKTFAQHETPLLMP
jgi:hypothetical protein